ncbi:MAG: UvrB/UvrC motif-containing protein [Candidatus Omnitrophica bacterium]|nr:UvrB/UvrC motif-containing protein [Candidatus Omnitrophota bacterium]
MNCDICHKIVATVHLTEIVNEKVVELHICQKCAKVKTDELKSQLSLSDFLGGLVDKPDTKKTVPTACPLCGLTFNEFREKGRLGCGECYGAFKDQILPLFRKIHGSTQHVGKIPAHVEKKILIDREKEELKNRLARAVKLEEYEEAARIRDKLKHIRQKRKR